MAIEALVVGAGPVGLAMAMELTRYGAGVRVIDKAAERTDKSKALVIWPRTLELMNRGGVAAKLVAAGMQATGANVVAGSEELARITLDGVDSPYPYALMIPQSETERVLEEHLLGLGVKVERGMELTGFEQRGEIVVAQLGRPGGGKVETVEASWMLGCDGAHSAVRHGLAMEFEGDTQPSDWVLADLHLEGVPRPNEISIIWHADGLLALFPITPGRYRVIADAGRTRPDQALAGPTLAQIQKLLDERAGGTMRGSDPIWLAGFHINERKVKDYRQGRVFVAGDAAHVHSPAGGQGMNTGMQDACNLAWKLALVHCRGCSAEPLLGSYSAERSAVGDRVLRETGYGTVVAILRGSVKQAIRNRLFGLVMGLEAARAGMAENLTELAIGYPESPLNAGSGGHGGPKPGERAPIRLGERPIGWGSTPRFCLFSDVDGAEELLADFAGLLEPTVRRPFAEGGAWLVRPDGYVAASARKGELSPVRETLSKLQGSRRLERRVQESAS